jgi:hypothetical protein
MGLLVGYATATEREAWAGEDSSLYSTALLGSLRASDLSDTMSMVLQGANAAVHAHGVGGQLPALYDNLGPLGPVAFFHGVHGLLPVCTAAPVRVTDVAGKLLVVFETQVCELDRLVFPLKPAVSAGMECCACWLVCVM